MKMLRKLAAESMTFPIMIALLVASVVLLIWLNGLYVNADMLTLGSLSGLPWKMVQVGADGEVFQTLNAPIITAVLFGLTAMSAVTLCFAMASLPRRQHDMVVVEETKERSKSLDVTSARLQGEMSNVAGVIGSHIDLNAKHTGWLGQLNRSLPGLTKPEQVSKIVLTLIKQNDDVQIEASKLREKLRLSQSQVEALRATLADAEEVGMRDALTALHNRRWLDAHMADMIAEASSSKKGLCLVVADLDHFKRINDTYGHLVGDDVLRRFAKMIVKNIKGRDSAVRYGGEEFVIVLPDTPVEGARAISEQLRRELEAKKWVVTKGAQDLGTITASFGVTQYRNGDDLEDLIDRADTHLYEAKRAGRNRVVSDGAA